MKLEAGVAKQTMSTDLTHFNKTIIFSKFVITKPNVI